MATFRVERKLYANPKNISNKWKINKSIPGTSIHPNRSYSYNLVWLDPDTGTKIDNFVYNESIYHRRDLSKSRRVSDEDPMFKNYMEMAKNDVLSGYVFEDNDRYRNKNLDKLSRSFDTCTHYIENLSDLNKLVFTKTIDFLNRLSYTVYKPEKIDGVWICRVEFNNFLKHRYNDKDYMRTI